MLNNQEISPPVFMEDLGQMFTAVSSKRKRRFGLYKCSCGNDFKTRIDGVKSGEIKSCGFYQKKKASIVAI